MPVEKISMQAFGQLRSMYPVFDVRSPQEYQHAHIPGAHSLPIFTDAERSEIGTLYKQVSREKAIEAGLAYFGPRLNQYIETVKKHTPGKQIIVHCWRGGMRSGAMAWLLGFYGYEVYQLEGGYKAYRNQVLQQLSLPFQLIVLGGSTGSGKTDTLNKLKQKGFNVIDLERLAAHKGSAFGNLEHIVQPSQEQFENNLVQALQAFYQTNEEGSFIQPQPIFVENESQRLGHVDITGSFYKQMLAAPLLVLDVPFEQRLELICKQYGGYDTEQLIAAILRISKKLGGLDTKNAIGHLIEKDLKSCFAILLRYYDKRYHESLGKSGRKPTLLTSYTTDAETNAALICKHLM